jgi:hypothetical protein
MPTIINEHQYGFTINKRIRDNALSLHSILENGKRKINTGWAVLLDQEKAYDKISWKYLIKILEAIGAPKSFISWVQTYMKSNSANILYANNRSTKVRIQRGLRQGDPMSPYLFNLAFDPLLYMISKRIEGLKVSKNKNISCMAFADDLITFISSKKEERTLLKCIEAFSSATGATFNKEKTIWIPINNPEWSKERWKPETSPFRHLGYWFNKEGIDIKTNEEKLITMIKRTSQKICKANLSVIGAARAVNVFMLSIPNHWSRVVPFTKGFMGEIKKIANNTIWFPNQPRRKLEIAQKRTEEGGLDVVKYQIKYKINLLKGLGEMLIDNNNSHPWKKDLIESLTQVLRNQAGRNNIFIWKRLQHPKLSFKNTEKYWRQVHENWKEIKLEANLPNNYNEYWTPEIRILGQTLENIGEIYKSKICEPYIEIYTFRLSNLTLATTGCRY